MRMARFRGVTAAISALMLVGTMLATSASADGGDVERHGTCSGAAHWEFDASHENGRIEMEFEVDSAKAGKTWHVKLSHNGSVFDTLNKTTDHEGNFDVDRYVNDTSGTDTLGAKAVSPSGQVCKGRLSI